MYDLLIIGSGPAGVSAALSAKARNLDFLWFGSRALSPKITKAERVINYPGLPSITGTEMRDAFLRQTGSLGISILEERVNAVYDMGGYYTSVVNEKMYDAKAVILATGVSSCREIPGESRLLGRGVSYCAVCDAFFYRGKEVAVLGNEDYAIHEMSQILPIVKSAVLLTNGQELKTEVPEGVQVIREPLRSVDGTERVEGITFEDGSRIAAEGLFVALGSAGAMELARKAGAFTEGQNIKVNERMETNIPGLYAAGDCIGGLLQISTAVGEGAQAAMSMIPFVRRQRKENEAHRQEP